VAKRPYRQCVQIGNATLYLGDCIELLKAGMLKADAVVSDPPYGIGFQHSGGGVGLIGATRKLGKIIGDGVPFDPSPWLGYDKVVLMGADHFAARLPQDKGDLLVWDKSVNCGPNASFRDVEFAWSSTRTPRNIYRHVWMGAMRESDSGVKGRKERHHVSQKPVALMQWLIATCRIKVGKTVLDPYMGSGSTGVACLLSGHRFVGVEIDPDHFATACNRIREQHEAHHA